MMHTVGTILSTKGTIILLTKIGTIHQDSNNMVETGTLGKALLVLESNLLCRVRPSFNNRVDIHCNPNNMVETGMLDKARLIVGSQLPFQVEPLFTNRVDTTTMGAIRATNSMELPTTIVTELVLPGSLWQPRVVGEKLFVLNR